MNKIEVKCFINGENELGSSSLYLSRTEPWDQVVYKMSLKVNKPQGSNPLVYNENGVVVKSVAELEDGQKLYFAANGEEFVPLPGSCIFYSFYIISSIKSCCCFTSCCCSCSNSSNYSSFYTFYNLFYSLYNTKTCSCDSYGSYSTNGNCRSTCCIESTMYGKTS